MPVTTVQASPEVVRAFVQEYFDAWKGTDEDKILTYYSDSVVLQLPTGTLQGIVAVRDSFVRPFIGAFPGNVHAIRNLAHANNLVAVEWSFEATHAGSFADVPPAGRFGFRVAPSTNTTSVSKRLRRDGFTSISALYCVKSARRRRRSAASVPSRFETGSCHRRALMMAS